MQPGVVAEALLAPTVEVDRTGRLPPAREGVVEAISATGTAAPVFAVQWHPEWRPEGRPHDLAFWNYLGEAARADYLPAAQSGT